MFNNIIKYVCDDMVRLVLIGIAVGAVVGAIIGGTLVYFFK